MMSPGVWCLAGGSGADLNALFHSQTRRAGQADANPGRGVVHTH
jgi:hypothetical protein